MMITILPNCSQAIVPLRKVEDYLLNFTHRQGKSKALFFSKFGYSRSNSRQLVEALREFACDSLVIEIEQKLPFGVRMTTEGRLRTPDSRNPSVRIGWFFDEFQSIPRLITVIPKKSK